AWVFVGRLDSCVTGKLHFFALVGLLGFILVVVRGWPMTVFWQGSQDATYFLMNLQSLGPLKFSAMASTVFFSPGCPAKGWSWNQNRSLEQIPSSGGTHSFSSSTPSNPCLACDALSSVQNPILSSILVTAISNFSFSRTTSSTFSALFFSCLDNASATVIS